MDRLTILVCRPNKNVTPTNNFFKVPIICRFMPLVGVIRGPVESRLEAWSFLCEPGFICSIKPGSHRKIAKDYGPKTGKDHDILRESV